MRTLNLSQCKEYLRNIMNLELSCYQQKQLITQLKRQPHATEKQISELEHRLFTEKKPTKPQPVIDGIGTVIIGFFYSFSGAMIGVVIAIAVRILLAIFSSKIQLFSPSWSPYIFWGAVIGYAVVFVVVLYSAIAGIAEDIAKRKAYPQIVESYYKEQQGIKDLIEAKKKSLGTTIPHEIMASEETYRQTKKLLQEYYDMGFIYPKYRGLVPVCTIYEYLESGRCFSLLGHEGAYNLYENELRMNAIIGKLDDVIDRLEDISASQRLLAQEIKQSNAQLSRISSTLDNIENNTALTQYYSSITASNTTFMNWLVAFSRDEKK